MGKARGVTRRRKKRYNYDVNRKGLHKKLHRLPHIECDQIRNAWDRKKSMRQNLRDMGLAADPNEVLPAPKTKDLLGPKDTAKSQHAEHSNHQNGAPLSNVVSDLEQEASAPKEKRLRLSSEYVKFCVYMLEKYCDRYEDMARDKKNYYQETAAQIRKKINIFKSIPVHWNAYLRAKGMLPEQAELE